MQITMYHVDTFTDRLFAGNPAMVCVLPHSISVHHMQTIAYENNLPVTVYLVSDGKQFTMRSFTPDYELPRCGHGTLAAAYIIFTKLDPKAQQQTLTTSLEIIHIQRQQKSISFNFPIQTIELCAENSLLSQGLGIIPEALYQYNQERCLAILNNYEQLKNLNPDMQILKQLIWRGIIVTAPSNDANIDFASRTFYPHKTISEDPVTGSSHCLLAPYWSKRLNKRELHAYQASPRGGYLTCKLLKDSILISGKAVLYLQGKIELRAEEN